MKKMFSLEELRTLYDAEVIDDAGAMRLAAFYAGIERKRRSGGYTALKYLLALLAAAFLGGALVLAVRSWWGVLPDPVRVIFAVAPLVAAVVAGGHTILARRSRAWSEASAAGIMLGIFLALVLIDDIYQLGGRSGELLGSALWMGVAFVYIFGSAAGGAIFLAGLACGALPGGFSEFSLIGLLWAITPFLVWMWWLRRDTVRAAVLRWFAFPALLLAATNASSGSFLGGVFAALLIAGIFTAAGISARAAGVGVARNPWIWMGIALLALLSFRLAWPAPKVLGIAAGTFEWNFSRGWTLWLIPGWLYMLLAAVRRREPVAGMLALAPALIPLLGGVEIGYPFLGYAFGVYLVLLAALMLWRGAREYDRVLLTGGAVLAGIVGWVYYSAGFLDMPLRAAILTGGGLIALAACAFLKKRMRVQPADAGEEGPEDA